ncbi:MAG TPA: ABC transporter permease, partial [Blastocatellia bacterium]|nr:ABC transporter permease [Blastocatellia bacterium]
LVTWILHELSYDRFHKNESRLYRSSMEYSFGGLVARTSVSPTALLPAMLTLPEVQTGARFFNQSAWNPFIVRRGDKLFSESKFCFADSTFFDVFSYELIKGNPQKALSQPYQVLLTESTARKYFGDSDPVGQTLNINNNREYMITGVIKDSPTNSFLQFDFVASFSSLNAGRSEPIWWSANYLTFVVLNEGADVKAVEKKSSEIAMRAVGGDITAEGDYVRYNMMLLKDLHLHSDFANEPEVVSNVIYVYIFAGIAALILIIACINYINLTTARATERAREVGIRKVAGALRQQLFYQFMAESAWITFSAFLLAFGIASLLMPFFNELTGKQFSTELLFTPRFLGWSV